ncbi:MAG TPA: methionine adenosyltransferase [bacterium]
MMNRKFLFTSESVTEGHPDKICDQISDSILDNVISQDKNSRVACEALVKTGMVIIAGEITTSGTIDFQPIVRETIKDIGYTDGKMGFDWQSCAVLVAVEKQSPDIAQGVNNKDGMDQGAGDQGMMFGYACNETPELMPTPISFAHKLTMQLAKKRRSGLEFLRPDGKSQVTIEYENSKPKMVTNIIIAAQHSPDISQKVLHNSIIEEVIKPIIPSDLMAKNTNIYVNPTGRFVIGGPQGDCGLTGRKIMVDTYGGMGRHGGGCFSGKDPSKVDRSGAYMARYIAKNIVAAGLADRCETQIAYAIGVAKPVSFMIDTFGTAKVEESKIEKACLEIFDMRPMSIIKTLDLLRPIYKKTASYGHFGRSESEFSWERTDKVAELKKSVK